MLFWNHYDVPRWVVFSIMNNNSVIFEVLCIFLAWFLWYSSLADTRPKSQIFRSSGFTRASDILIWIKTFDMIFLIYYTTILAHCACVWNAESLFFPPPSFFFRHPCLCLCLSHCLSHSRACCTVANAAAAAAATAGKPNRRSFEEVSSRQTPQVICTSCEVTVTGEHVTYRLFFFFPFLFFFFFFKDNIHSSYPYFT